MEEVNPFLQKATSPNYFPMPSIRHVMRIPISTKSAKRRYITRTAANKTSPIVRQMKTCQRQQQGEVPIAKSSALPNF
ncbi:hypothetical protein JTE90_028331 [Oedothorax gibbosus]|uniref:Uncharacterized protein n=1 Tax=Oedothorax gibbosus TaxID=931172 RepID=A0AAV6V310_9ARAC|nr:hypothetical protein JTE90_028331 [Oedothorax gibbosus]